MKSFNNFIRLLIALSLLTPAFAMAQVNADVGASATVETNAARVRANATASTTLGANVVVRAKARAAEEIERRTKALGAMRARIAAMNKVTAEFKQNLNANVDVQVNNLASLRARIEGQTDTAALKVDVQSITRDYRIYALVMPQARIAAAADRAATLINMLATLGTKLQTRLEVARAAGSDVTALASALTDMGVRLQSAQAHAQAAVNGSATLTPDNGDKAIMESNLAALKKAREEIKAAHEDIVAARKDVDTIVKGLRALSVKASASTTVQTQ